MDPPQEPSEPHLSELVCSGGLAPPRRRQRSSPAGRPHSLPSFPFQQVTEAGWPSQFLDTVPVLLEPEL